MDLSFSTPQEIVHRVCERLRVERVAQSMTQGELAARAGVSKSTISNVESGQSVRFEYIVRVAMALGPPLSRCLERNHRSLLISLESGTRWSGKQ